MNPTNPPPPPLARPIGTSTMPPPAVGRSRFRQMLWAVVAVLVVALVLRMCAGGENKYEKIAHELTQAIANGDVAAVQRLENSGTAADMSRARLGAATDKFTALGKIERVHEDTPATDPPRVHEFDVTFAKGTVHEKIELDPQDKVFHFRWDTVQPK
ncbi:MAG TPA: hypothetical protein VGN14_17525 [Candidatus Elarobacter sp.]|jgi:DNA-binding GntR family transcriptional regulator